MAVLLFLLVGVTQGLFGWTLTIGVPENVTAVTLQRTGEVMHPLDVTLTAPEDVAAFTGYLSGIGKLREAHISKNMWSSGAPFVITLHTADGSRTEYVVKDDLLMMEDSPWFWFPGYFELRDLILSYQPAANP